MTAFSRTSSGEIRSIEPTAAPVVEEPHRRNVVLSLWNHRWLILIITLLFLAAAAIKLIHATPIYAATSRITVEQNRPPIVSNDPNAEVNQSQNFLSTQGEIIKSRSVLEAVQARDAIATLPTFKSEAETANVINYLRSNLIVNVGRRDDVIGVSVMGPNKEDDAAIANAIVDEYGHYVANKRHGSTADVLNLLRSEKAKLDDQIDKKRQEKLDFQQKYASLLIGNERTNPTLDRLQQLQSELTTAQLDSITAQADFDTTKAMASDPSKVEELLNSRVLRADSAELRRQIREMQSTLGNITGNYLPGMAEYSKAQLALKELNEEKAREDKNLVDAYLAELQTRANFTQQKQSQLQAAYNEQSKQ
ncbi:MAG: hypothetical protein JO353_00660, partial [Phycisphaerae bacterium]|nr:hypothetical protein [Phycisphaerae bacterium]